MDLVYVLNTSYLYNQHQVPGKQKQSGHT